MPAAHWTPSLSVELREDGAAIIRFELANDPLNRLGASFADELSSVLARLEHEPGVKAVVFASGNRESFIAGADIHLLQTLQSAQQAAELSRAGQRALNALAGFGFPVVAAIHGACLGGGLELALACSARVASTDAKTQFGLPEVQLGIVPALGGTQRLPRLVGIESALDLLLTGKQIAGKHALRLGLIDELVPNSILLDVAVRSALSRALGRPARKSRLSRLFDRAELKELALAENAVGRKLLFERAKKQVALETHGNYPAPERILEVVKLGLAAGLARGLEAEADAFGELVVSDTARALRHVFFASNELKKDPGHEAGELSGRPIRRVATLGAGSMGSGIAYLTAAVAEVDVRVKDRDHASLGKGLRRVRGLLDERVNSDRLSTTERDSKMARVTATTDYEGFESVDLVIEAVSEDLNSKRQVLAEVERAATRTTILATSTSCLPIARIAAGVRRPEQVIGMHYFSPPEKTRLLEVVVTDATLPRVIASAVAFGKRQGKTVIVVRDGVGFYTSRILGAYLAEASFLILEGVPIEQIDAALVAWGLPVGPIAVLDDLGIDVSARVAQALHDAFGPRLSLPPGLEALLKDERLGKKNQRGFYSYSATEKAQPAVDPSVYSLLGVEPKRQLANAEVAQRCVLRMINEAAHCFGEGILRSARDGDVGAIFGLGFPAFRGGPFHYLDAIGVPDAVRRLESYVTLLGARFTPAPVLTAMARADSSFYGPAAMPPGQHRS